MKKKLIWASVVIAILLFLYGVGSWYFSSLIIDFPVRGLEKSRAYRNIESFAALGLPEPEDVDVESDGLTLVGWLFRNPSGKRCGVVANHGHRSNRYGALSYGALFFERGCHLLVFDARHHGESDGDYGTYGYFERHDLRAMIEHFSSASGLQHKEIGIFGVSMGASIALQTAALMPDLAFVAGDAPYGDFARILRLRGEADYGSFLIGMMLPGALWLAEARTGADFDDISPRADAARIAMPVWLLHSKTDTYTPLDHSQSIYDAIPHDRKELHLTDWGEQHAESLKTNPDGYQQLIDGFLDRYAPGF